MDKQTGKLIARIAENLPDISGDLMQGWIDNPRGLQKFLTGLCPPETAHRFRVWKTIKLGTGLETADDFRRAFKATGCRIGNLASDILDKPAFTASDTEMELDLFNVSVAELGFKDGATRRDIYERALKLDLELCPNETGPQLRLQYQDQPRGEWLLIGMEPIRSSDGGLSIFNVVHGNDELWLYGCNGNPDDLWDSGDRFVFCRRK